MKKFEVVFNDSNYDYVTKNMVYEYLKSAFTKAEIQVKTIPQKKKAELVKHGHLINLPKALDPSERPVMCSVCKSVTSLYHGYKPRYCSNCGIKFDGRGMK